MNVPQKLSQLGEFGLIAQLKKSAALNPGVIKGIGDDTAVLKVSRGKELLFTTDMLVEDVHFTRAIKPTAVGHKALACNISDVAAMGGLPKYAVVSLGVPATLSVNYVADIYRGINTLAKKFGVAIVGGDTVASKKIVINIALLGEAKRSEIVYRSGAKVGDWIFVTGPLGRSFPTGKHLTFTPRVKEARFLVEHFKPNAMIDISDGLVADLGHILEESKVGAVLEETAIPRVRGASLNQALGDGEDFELLFTLPMRTAARLMKSKIPGVTFYKIGEIVPRAHGLAMVAQSGLIKPLTPKGYRHF